MMHHLRGVVAGTLALSAVTVAATDAGAMPIQHLTAPAAATAGVEHVWWRGGWGRGFGWRGGYGFGWRRPFIGYGIGWRRPFYGYRWGWRRPFYGYRWGWRRPFYGYRWGWRRPIYRYGYRRW